MFVHQINASGSTNRRLVDPGDPRTQHNFDLGIPRLDCFLEQGNARAVTGSLIFIADLDVFERERRRMSVRRPPGTPFRVNRSDRILDRIQRVIDQWFQLIVRDERAATKGAGYSSIHNIEGICSNVVGKPQKLVIAESIGAPVSPRTVRAGTTLERPDTALPLGAIFDCDTFHKTSPGKPYESRLEIGDHLRQIRPEAIWSVAKSLRWK